MSGAAGPDPVFLEPAAKKHIDQFIATWVPFDIYRKLTNPSWTYRIFPWDSIIRGPFESFAVVTPRHTEGLLAFSRKLSVLEVDFLSTAPWNFGPDKQRSGIGTGLISYAVTVARQAGMSDVTLKSTRESETFYERIGWTRTGSLYKGLAIFQLSADRFDVFVDKNPPFGTL